MRSARYRAALTFACAVFLVALIAPASAQLLPRVAYAQDGNQAIVTINDRTAVRFRVANGGLSPLERATITAGRLKPLAYGDWRQLQAKTLGDQRAQVVAGGQLICIATHADAKAARTSAAALAALWAGRLRELFAMPPVQVKPDKLTVPELERRWVRVDGAAVGEITAVSKDPTVAVAAFDPARRAVYVQGVKVGRCTVVVSRQGFCAELPVDVKRYAARIARTAVAEVTGNPVPTVVVRAAAADAAPGAVALEAGASATYAEPNLSPGTLTPGGRLRATVPVRASGEGLIPIELKAPVEVFDCPLVSKPPSRLFYSNEPEKISRYGGLFGARLAFDERERLFFHHINVMGKPLVLRVEVFNAGQAAARVHSVSGMTSPRQDPVDAGYRAGVSFIRDFVSDVGRIHRIPPRSRLVLYTEKTENTRTASGIVDLRVIEGSDVYVQVFAEPPANGSPRVGQTAPAADGEVPGAVSPHVYVAPAKQVEATYVVGERWQFIRIGKFAIKNGAGDKQLYGNYGVVYEVKVRAENPTDSTKTVRLSFEPTAGPASGLFVLGGKLISAKTVLPPHEFEITSLRLAPGQSKELTLRTMPTGGSAYPATIIVKS